MNIEHIREFLMLASNMSFSETSRRLYITQSTLSRHISSIEEEIGAKLLVRDSHHVRLTDVGKCFLEDAALIVKVFDNSLDHIEQLKKGAKRILRIGYLYDAGRSFLPRLTRMLQTENEHIAPQYQALEYGELERRFADRKVDIALTIDFGRKTDKEITVVQLGEDRYFAAVPKDHRLASRESISLEEIARESVLFPDPDAMGAVHTFFGDAIEMQKHSIAPAGFYKDIPSLIYQIEAGEGISLVLGHHRKRYGDVIAFVPISDLQLTCHIVIMWSARSEEFVDGSWPAALKRFEQ